MNTTLTETIKSLAISRAAKLCTEALADLEKGRKTFVKGKPVFVPFSDEARVQRKALQLSAFQPGYQVDEILSKVPGLTEEDADEARTLYCAAGRAEVERLWVTT